MSYSSEVLADSPLLYWRLGESSGTTAADSSGNSHPGTYVGSPTLGVTGLLAGDANTAVDFDGTNDSVTVAHGTWLNTAGFTVSGRFRVDSLAAEIVIASQWGASTGAQRFLLSVQTDGSVRFASRTTINSFRDLASASGLVTVGAEHTIAIAYSGSTKRILLDGAVVATATDGDVGTQAAPFVAGSSTSFFFNGVLDEIAYFGSDLSNARLLAQHQAAVGAGSSLVSLAGSLPGLTSVVSLDAASPVSLAAEVPGLTSAFTLDVALPPEISLSGSLPGLAGSFGVEASSPMSLSAALPGLTGALNLTAETVSVLSLAAELPGLSSVITLDKPPETDTSNRVGGRERGGYGVATWAPAVVAPPVTVVVPQGLDVLEVPTTDTPDLTVGKPVFTYDTVTAPRHRDRIIVAGHDVTFFRGAQTPTPSFRLVEPFLYGAGSMSVPQVYPAFEQMGVGDRKWIRKGAPVIVQRVDPDTGAVVATDYRGFISNIHLSGGKLTLELGGKVTGRMALVDKQPRLFRTTADLGRWVAAAMWKGGRAVLQPSRGPVTGIELQSRETGGTWLDHAAELLALAVDNQGRQYTVDERADGTWRMRLKDTTTIDATVYFDDSRMVADLHSAIAEEPNRIFASGVAHDGRRIKFASYPGLKQGDPARYPFANTATTFGLGTTSADTDYPEMFLIEAFKARLVTMGYLTPTDNNDGTIDADAVDAIKDVQDDAGLAQTGVVNLATWEAAFDISATGYSLTNAEIRPAAQRSYVERWRRSSSGARIARNPPFDPHAIPVDETLDMGNGFTRRQIRDWAQKRLGDAATPNWIGTLTVQGESVNDAGCMALVRGEHTPGDPITAADIMPAREIRPGMNIWAPLFEGGTLFHVSGVSVPEGGNSPQFTIDTRARDTMAAWEVITRNRESRSNPARAWLNANRRGGMPDNFLEWDDIAGRLDESVAVKSGEWTVFPVLAGQEGTVAQLRMRLDPAVRFSVAVFARKVSERALNNRFPQPLSEAGDAAWDKPWKRRWLEDHGFVYQAGGSEQPCGYWPGRETGDDGEPTGDAVTGKWEDDAGFSYYTGSVPVLWVAVWAFESDSKVVAGRIMKALLEGGAP